MNCPLQRAQAPFCAAIFRSISFRISAFERISRYPRACCEIVNAADSHLPPSSVLWYRFPAAAELRAVNWAQLISTESHSFLQFGFGGN